MVAPKKTGVDTPRGKPATTVEARENQMIALAYDLAEKQMRDGTASSQVTTHFLKLGSIREQKELQKIEQDILLSKAKIASQDSQEDNQKLYSEALRAFSTYKGEDVEPGLNDEGY
jgi:hypothetical protein